MGGTVVRVIKAGQGLQLGTYKIVERFSTQMKPTTVKIGDGWYMEHLFYPKYVGVSGKIVKLKVRDNQVFLGKRGYSRKLFLDALTALVENGADSYLNFEKTNDGMLNINTGKHIALVQAAEILEILRSLS